MSQNTGIPRQLHENRRRGSRFILPAPRHLVAMSIGALAAALAVHYFGYVILGWFNLGVDVHISPERPVKVPEQSKIVLRVDDAPPPVPDAVKELEEMQKELEKVPEDRPDIEDIPLEEVVLAPGETSFAIDKESLSPAQEAELDLPQLDRKTILDGLPEPSIAADFKPTDDFAKIALKDPIQTNSDEWNDDKLKGAGGQDDSHLPDGSKTLGALMAQENLGKDSGFSRLGADLLFEYDKATLKNAARNSMVLLGSLMMKNPDTIFIVEGHTDSFGAEDYNAVLSLLRANAVRIWLQNNGIPLRTSKGQCRFYIRACGATAPVVDVKGDKNAQTANRRVEIHMRKQGEELPPNCLPDTFKVDMNTPVKDQVRKGLGAKVKTKGSVIPKAPEKTLATPDTPRQSSVKPPHKETQKETPPALKPATETIPAAEPIEDIPDAAPLPEEIPNADPLPEEIPLAEPLSEPVFVPQGGAY